jgi:hypothetical protein
MQVNQLSENQVEHWRLLYEEAKSDPKSVAYYKALDAQRLVGQKEMVEFLNLYLTGKITTEELRSTFDRKTRKEWNTFGLKGMSGAMFLNMLVKHVDGERALAEQLRLVLCLPKDTLDGREKMQAFLHYLEGVIKSKKATKRQIQPARTPFFISAWWHLQATEQWPIFYPLTRQMLELEGLYTSVQNPIEDYFSFRESFLSLATALHLTVWQLEHFSAWYGNEKQVVNGSVAGQEVVETNNGSTTSIITNAESTQIDERGQQTSAKIILPISIQDDDVQAVSAHTHIQWLLAKIGRKLGCRIWVAGNDQNKIWKDERLGDLSLKTLPNLWMDSEFQRIITLIDVLWLKGTNTVTAAFEVEHTTSIYSGLLRMSDLVALSPNINFPLYIVTPDVRLDKVRQELSRPTFQALELHKRCGFFSEEMLLQNAEYIMRWADNPSAIDRLASKVGDVDG